MATLVLEPSVVWCKCKGDREPVCDGDGEGKVGRLCTSLDRRDREGLCQRRDVRGNVATFQRVLLTNVATLEIHVATFQRVYISTSRRWKSTSQRSRELKNQRPDVGNPRRDVPETLKINVAAFESTSRLSREG